MNTLEDLRASLAGHAEEASTGVDRRALGARIRRARTCRRAGVAGAAAAVVLVLGGLASQLMSGHGESALPAHPAHTPQTYPAMYGSQKLARQFVWDVTDVKRGHFTVDHRFPAVVRYGCRDLPKTDRVWIAVDGQSFGGATGCAESGSSYTVHLAAGRHTLSASLFRRNVAVHLPQPVRLRVGVYDDSDRVRVGGVTWDRVLMSGDRGWTATRVLQPGRITPSTDVMLGCVAHREARLRVIDAHGKDVGTAFMAGGGTTWGTVLRAGHTYRVSVQGEHGRAGSRTATIVLFEPGH